jgi:hypothetical protein
MSSSDLLGIEPGGIREDGFESVSGTNQKSGCVQQHLLGWLEWLGGLSFEQSEFEIAWMIRRTVMLEIKVSSDCSSVIGCRFYRVIYRV